MQLTKVIRLVTRKRNSFGLVVLIVPAYIAFSSIYNYNPDESVLCVVDNR